MSLPGKDGESELLHEGRFISLVKINSGWEYATRTNARAAVGVLAVTARREIFLVEQFRPPVGRKVLELPAGLAGDEPYKEDEPLLAAARRELLEETGHVAANWWSLCDGPSSPGLTDESVTLFMATDLRKVSDNLGVGGEDIRLHVIPLGEVLDYLKQRREEGVLVDFKVTAALYHARVHPMFPQ